MGPGSPTTNRPTADRPSAHRTPPASILAPPARHAARDLMLRMRRLPEGGLRFTPADLPAFSATAKTPAQIPSALRMCATEVEIQAHELWKGLPPELAQGTYSADDPDETPVETGPAPVSALKAAQRYGRSKANAPWRSGRNDREQHPSVWNPNADGSFTNVNTGRTFRDPIKVAQIRARRLSLDLPIIPVDGVFDLSAHGLAEKIGKAAADAGVSPHEWLTGAVEERLADVVREPPPTPTVDLDALPTAKVVGIDSAPSRRRKARRVDPGQLELDLGLRCRLGVAA